MIELIVYNLIFWGLYIPLCMAPQMLMQYYIDMYEEPY